MRSLVSKDKFSINGNMWDLPPEINLSTEIVQAAFNDKLLAQIMLRRGFTDVSKINGFFNFDNYNLVSGFELPDMQKACDTTYDTISKNQTITVYGDYDVDGITGSAVLKLLFKYLNYDKVNYFIPNRFTDGYGLSIKTLTKIISKNKPSLIITCDCGVANIEEISFAKNLGAKTIVLDHHNMASTLPDASAIVHPKILSDSNHSLYHLSGVGVAFKFAQCMLEINNLRDKIEDFYEYVAMGLIADMVPLINENRYLVYKGLSKFANTNKPGLKALIEQTKDNSNGDLVGYNIAPKINAAGRLSDGNKALELLTTYDTDVAAKLSQELQEENAKRQEFTETIFNEASSMALSIINKNPDTKVLALFKENWHHGVVGIVATRLLEKFKKPVFIGEIMPETQLIKGSARGQEKFDLYSALDYSKEVLLKWGGHKVAAGFSLDLEKKLAFETSLNNYANAQFKKFNEPAKLIIDTIIEKSNINIEYFANIEKLAPFGMSNPKPVFLVKNLTCLSNFCLGKNKQHVKLVFSLDNAEKIEALIWNCHTRYPEPNEVIDLVFTPQIKTFNGKSKLSLIVNDWKSLTYDESYFQNQIEINNELEEEIAKLSNDKPELLIQKPAQNPVPNETVSKAYSHKLHKQIWKDLRQQNSIEEILNKSREKLGGDLTIYSDYLDPNIKSDAFTIFNRFEIGQAKHIILLDLPPNKTIFKQVIQTSSANYIYLSGKHARKDYFVADFVKELTGLCRFAVNKLDGCVAIDKMVVKLQATNEAILAGLNILNKVNLFDYYLEDNNIMLDHIESGYVELTDSSLMQTLETELNFIHKFHDFLKSANINDIASEIFSNQLNLITDMNTSESDEVSTKHKHIKSIANF